MERPKNDLLPHVPEKCGRQAERTNSLQGETKRSWLREWFEPTLECVVVAPLVEFVRTKEPEFGSEFSVFYDECQRFNRHIKDLEAAGGTGRGV